MSQRLVHMLQHIELWCSYGLNGFEFWHFLILALPLHYSINKIGHELKTKHLTPTFYWL